ncbi:allophanate hydrolase [Mycolicibacterium aurum]|uniref:Allophanate hydrolase n=1 Tax=Mycolicibacterium aurum TaxID=1791 RepID=A0A448IWK2_MYCAU|nr:amidase family protein [Mycolicibacterium aurum]VEG56800.1 allophanate hydrolase [Mycolicibacterium aurum]
MTVWITRRPDGEVAAELAESRRGTGSLAGVRLAVADNVDVADAAVVAALRKAGAVVVGRTNRDQFAVATGEADIAIATDTVGSGPVPEAPEGIAGIRPTLGVIGADAGAPARESPDSIVLVATTLSLADRAVAVAAAGAPSRPWPADVRLAAPPRPVVGVPHQLPELDPRCRAAFDAAVDTLAAAGCQIVTVDIAPFLDAATQLDNGAVVGERSPAAGEFSVHRLVADRIEVARMRERALAALVGADALLVPTAPTHPSSADVTADPAGIDARPGTYTIFCTLFDMCGVAVPVGAAGDTPFGVTVLARAFDDAVALDIAALFADGPHETVWPLAVAEHMELVVFGAHLRGGPLAHQLTDRGARFAGEITTAPRYRMTALPTTPAKPGVTRVPDGDQGSSLTGHRWLVSPAALGRFLAELPAPMQLGKVEFADGSWRTAFGCDGSARGVDISSYGSWPAAVAAGAVAKA